MIVAPSKSFFSPTTFFPPAVATIAAFVIRGMPQGLVAEEGKEEKEKDDQRKLRTAAALLPSDGLVAFSWVRVFAYCNSKLEP
jgi:hypothetical protein